MLQLVRGGSVGASGSGLWMFWLLCPEVVEVELMENNGVLELVFGWTYIPAEAHHDSDNIVTDTDSLAAR